MDSGHSKSEVKSSGETFTIHYVTEDKNYGDKYEEDVTITLIDDKMVIVSKEMEEFTVTKTEIDRFDIASFNAEELEIYNSCKEEGKSEFFCKAYAYMFLRLENDITSLLEMITDISIRILEKGPLKEKELWVTEEGAEYSWGNCYVIYDEYSGTDIERLKLFLPDF